MPVGPSRTMMIVAVGAWHASCIQSRLCREVDAFAGVEQSRKLVMKLRAFCVGFVLLLAVSVPASGDDPGLVVVIGEDPEPVEFSVPASSDYKFAYDPAAISLWDTVTKDNLIPPDTVLVAPSAQGDTEPDCDVDLLDIGAFQRCFTGPGGGPVPTGCGLLDFDTDDDVDADEYAVLEPGVGGPAVCGSAQITVYVEGFVASSALGDVTITLLVDAEGDGTFVTHATQPVTVVSVGISPLSGPLGTAITVTLDPAIAPLAFDSATTADWAGQFEPLGGAPPPDFNIAYSSDEVHEQSVSVAIVVVGDGTSSDEPDPVSFGTTGQVPGVLTLDFGDHQLSRSFVFTFELSGEWHRVGFASDGARSVGSIPDRMDYYQIDPVDPTFDVAELPNAYWYFRTFVLRVDDNPTSAATVPASMEVTLVTLDPGALVVDTVPATLFRITADDGDPANFVYYSDVARPVILVDSDVNKDDFPDLTILKAVDGGGIVAIP